MITSTVYDEAPSTPEEIYLKSLTKWSNSRISPKHGAEYQCTVENIIPKVSCGVFLMLLINSLHGTPIPVFEDSEDSKLTHEQQHELRRKNVLKAFDVIRESEACIAESLLDVEKIVAGDINAVTDLLWEIAYQFQIKTIVFESLESVDGLRKWCQAKTGTDVTDFDESWRDGMLYARIIAQHRPALVNMKALESMDLDKRLDTLFTVFEEKLDLVPILDDEDISTLTGPRTDYVERAVELFLSDVFHLFAVSETLAEYPVSALESVPQEDRWALPQAIGGRNDLVIEWFSDTPSLQHVELVNDSDLVPDVQVEFTSFMEGMLERAWVGRGFNPLRVFEANSYHVHHDCLTRVVFISEIRPDGNEVVLLGFSSEEHGERSAPNERHRSYLQYLASTCLEPKESRRTKPTVAEAALICYARWLELTYRSSYFHIWVDPPDSRLPEYFFRNCSQNVSIPWCMKNKEVERTKLMNTYQHIFNAWDLQSYVWRPEIIVPPSFEKDFKASTDMDDDDDDAESVNVRREIAALLDSAKQLSQKLNKYFEKRTLVLYLSEVTILARDPNKRDRLLTKKSDDAEALVEVGVEDVTPLCPRPLPSALIPSNLVKNEELSFSRKDDYIGSSRKLREMVESYMRGTDYTRDEHQRATGIVEVEDE